MLQQQHAFCFYKIICASSSGEWAIADAPKSDVSIYSYSLPQGVGLDDPAAGSQQVTISASELAQIVADFDAGKAVYIKLTTTAGVLSNILLHVVSKTSNTSLHATGFCRTYSMTQSVYVMNFYDLNVKTTSQLYMHQVTLQ